MGEAKEMAGERFGRLIVIERRGSSSNGSALWLCRCDCDEEREVAGSSLRTGKTKSCGCARVEALTASWNSRARLDKAIRNNFRKHPRWAELNRQRLDDEIDREYGGGV